MKKEERRIRITPILDPEAGLFVGHRIVKSNPPRRCVDKKESNPSFSDSLLQRIRRLRGLVRRLIGNQ